jgi:Kelch motif protein
MIRVFVPYRVLATGGQRSSSSLLASTEAYDPRLGTWAAAGSMLTERYFHAATRGVQKPIRAGQALDPISVPHGLTASAVAG